MKVNKRDLIGRKIVNVEWNSFRAREGRERTMATDPMLVLDDGTRLRFLAEETDFGYYGVKIIKMDGKAEATTT
jgi:hypothetical protein